jgi:hypothetical protein
MKKAMTIVVLAIALISLSIVVSLFVAVARAEEKNMPKTTSGKVLDFEADVIEGERAAPDLLLEFSSDAPTMDSVILKRTDFNDFHEVSMKRRLRYQASGTPKK